MHNRGVVNVLDTAFAALSDPTRRQILKRLTAGPATVQDLTVPFAISQQAISKHVATLERAKLLHKRRQGREHICSLNAAPIRGIVEWAMTYQRFWDESYERLDELLKSEAEPEASAKGKAGARIGKAKAAAPPAAKKSRERK